MIAVREIGALAAAPPKPANERRVPARAVVPLTGEVREVEMFDARPAVNQRQEIATRANSSYRYLSFARTLLDPSEPAYAPVAIELEPDEEAILYVGRGRVRVQVENENHALEPQDVLYLPIGARATMTATSRADVSEFRAAECSVRHPVQRVRHADIAGTQFAADLGSKRPMTERTVYKLVDLNVQACRLLFGDTYLKHRGGVGSYPPHFHGPEGPFGLDELAKEEIYHFRCESDIEGDTPFLLQNCARPGEPVSAYVHVFDDQAINVTPSYHDTIAPPAVDFMFSWCLASHKEGERDWGRIHNRPGYEDEW